MFAMLTMSFRMSSQTDDYTAVSFTVYVLHPADTEGVGSLLRVWSQHAGHRYDQGGV